MNDEYRPRQEPVTRNLTRRQRRAVKRGHGRPGGVTAVCGCRYARTGGAWVHVWACSSRHALRLPVAGGEPVNTERITA